MRPAGRLFSAVAFLLVLMAVGYAARFSDLLFRARLELGPSKLIQLEEDTRASLRGLDSQVLITYFTSPPHRMPSHMRRVEPGITALLESMRRASRGMLDYQVVDPDSDPEMARFAAHHLVSPFRARHVSRDAYSERTVWSALAVEYGARRPAVLNGLGPEHLPRLQATLTELLDQMRNPRRPVFALSAPAGFSELRGALEERGRLVEVDIESPGTIPEEVDLLFLLEANRLVESDVREITRFMERGGGVVVAPRGYGVEIRRDEEGIGVLVADREDPAHRVLGSFGLRPVSGLVMDRHAEQLTAGGEPLDAPFLVRCIPYNQDFQTLAAEPNGHLLFAVPTPFDLDPGRLAESGFSAEVLATTSDDTWIQPLTEERIPLERLHPAEGEPVPKLPLLVLLRPRLPWQGQLVAFASPTPLADGFFHAPGFAHTRLLEVLLDSLTADERLVMTRAPVPVPEPLPTLGPGTRWLWRFLTVTLVPLLLLAAALARYPIPRPVRPRLRPRAPAVGIALWGLVGLALGLSLAWGLGRTDLRVDLTSERINRLSPETRRLAQDFDSTEGIRVDLVFSPHYRLPPELRPHVRDLRRILRELARAGTKISWSRVIPEDLGEDGLPWLAERGVEPVQVTSREEERTVVRTVYSSLVLSVPDRAEVLTFRDTAAFEHLEFRLAFALWRLRTGSRPHIGFAADVPRLTPAEAYEYYQTQGLFAPVGTDVYSLARGIVADADFRVTHINPRNPEIPPDLDLLVWLQPRRRIEPMLEEMIDYLRRGGSVLLAAQHFNLQSRQYPGSDFKMVYWPQPQSPEVERLYFPDLGVRLVREVLFDELSTRIALRSQVERSGRREFETMVSALPFSIRAAAGNFSEDSLVTRGLGDQAFTWANHFDLDEARLARLGVRVTPLITTSSRTWSFAWTGGWLPDDVLDGPDLDERGRPAWLGRKPLAVLLEGTFPPLVLSEEEGGAEGPEPPSGEATEDGIGDSALPGRLLFIGCSEVFKSHRIRENEFRGDHLLLNAAAALALDEDLARVMTRRRTAEGFDFVSPGQRLFWRGLVVGGPILPLLAVAGLRARLSRRRSGSGPGRAPIAGGRGSTPVARGLRWAAWGSVPVVLLGFAYLDLLPARGDGGRRGPPERVAPLLPEDLREGMVPAVLGVQTPGGEPYYYGRSQGVWRCLNYRNAVASESAVQGVVASLLSAQGTLRETDPEEAWKYGLGTVRMGRAALFGPRFLQDRGRRDLIFQVDVGSAIPGRDGSFVRPSGTSEVWAVFPSLRVEGVPEGEAAMPPLLDPHVIPEAWPGRAAMWRAIAVEMLGGPSFRLELSPEAGGEDDEAPWGWLVTSAGGVRAAFPSAATAYNVFLRTVPHAEILDPAAAEEWGFHQPIGRIRVLPFEGEPLELTVGRSLGDEGVTLLNRTFQTAFRVDAEVASLMFPSLDLLQSPSPENPWARWLAPPSPFGGPQGMFE
jgi:hypothetical protein